MKMNTCLSAVLVFVSVLLTLNKADAQQELLPENSEYQVPLSLRECINIALANNQSHHAASSSIEIAEAKYEQAMSGYWPELALRAIFTTMDEDPLFGQPSFIFNMSEMQLPIQIPPIKVPEQKIRMMDNTNLNTSLNLTYPLYTGGLLTSIVKQAESGVNAAKEDLRKTDLQIIYDVKKNYNAAILTRQLYSIAEEALQKLEATLNLTENLYKKGSGKVKKTDYLRNKVIVEQVRAMVVDFEIKEKIVNAALINTLGLNWSSSIRLSDSVILYNPYLSDLNSFIKEALNSNPDWVKIKYGINAANAKIDEAFSGYLPKLSLIGNFTKIFNSYDKGYVLPENKTGWTVGLGMEMPLFSGFLTNSRVKEAEAELRKLQQQQILLKEGLALQIKNLFLQMKSTQGQVEASKNAMEAAIDNRELNERAYQEDMVEIKDLIESQIMESLMKAQYQKYLFDHYEAQIHLEFTAGNILDR